MSNQSRKLRVGTLFSGVGGFDLGFEQAGFEVAWQCEIDPHCREVLRRHWPEVALFDDVKKVRGQLLGAVDVVVGGFPCQDLSVAGQRAGLAGERSGLWYEFRRVLSELRPGWVVIENVPGLLSSNKGRDFAIVLQGLAELGYGVTWRVLNAQYFGLAQRRKRVFIVGHIGDGRSAEVLFEPESVCGDPPARGTAGESLAKPLGGGSGERGFRDDLDHGAYVLTRRGRDGGSSDEVEDSGLCLALRTAGGGSSRTPTVVIAEPCDHIWELRGEGRFCVLCKRFEYGRMPTVASLISPTLQSGGNRTGGTRPPGTTVDTVTSLVLAYDTTQVTSAANRCHPAPGDACHPLAAGAHAPLVIAIQDGRGMEKAQNGLGVSDEGVAYTLDGTGAQGVPEIAYALAARNAKGPSLLGGQDNFVVQQASPRRLTPIECERLQGFADGHTAGQSDSHRYKQLGNAVAVPVVEWIARRILLVNNEPAGGIT